ncbi:hypothetical protein BYT27DRAFT_7212868 [Phlegmacium glaucopus]|nr:hypothetical protein BYT27DRAFT_7212868 [Phlegmacium glaucopus]
MSFPLIGLIQLVQELRSRISGATGHSQCIVSAVVIAALGTFKELTDNSRKAIRWLFYSGLRGQQAFPVTSVEPSIVQDAIELQPHVSQTNQHLHRVGLIRAKRPSLSESPIFSVRFLIVGVPYQSEHLNGVTNLVAEEDLDDEELWEAKDLKIPVYNTEDGSDMRELKSSIMRSRCDQILTSPIHWTKATNFSETTTHAIDFGPGGLSDIGLLTARNLNGCGVRVIVAGMGSWIGSNQRW